MCYCHANTNSSDTQAHQRCEYEKDIGASAGLDFLAPPVPYSNEIERSDVYYMLGIVRMEASAISAAFAKADDHADKQGDCRSEIQADGFQLLCHSSCIVAKALFHKRVCEGRIGIQKVQQHCSFCRAYLP